MEHKPNDTSITVRFWGVRGSYPVPGMKTAIIGGNTSCVEIRAGGHIIICDAGTGIIALGKALVKEFLSKKKPICVNLLFSHMHHDHTQGWPFFAPAYIGGSKINILGADMFGEALEKSIFKAMTAPHFPVELQEMKSYKNFQTIDDSHFIILEDSESEPTFMNIYEHQEYTPTETQTIIRMQKGYCHPKGGVMYFKIERHGKTVVYATDTEGYKYGNVKLTQFCKNADLLIHDAQYQKQEYANEAYSKEGFGHSTPDMAIEIAVKSKTKQLVLFHHDPDHDDDVILEMERKAQKAFPNLIAGREGLEVSI